MSEEYEVAERFLEWLEQRIVISGRGDADSLMEVLPSGKFWLGRLAPEIDIISSDYGERGERLEPCAVGFRIKTNSAKALARIRFCAWTKKEKVWHKTDYVDESIEITFSQKIGSSSFGSMQITDAIAKIIGMNLTAEVRVETDDINGEYETIVTLVNTSASTYDSNSSTDTRLYECQLEILGAKLNPFLLETLPDAFRYDRNISAYGINCGVLELDNGIRTTDTIGVSKARPDYWGPKDIQEPDFTYKTLSKDPLSTAQKLVEAYKLWGGKVWSKESLNQRSASEAWTTEMLQEAESAALAYEEELSRLEYGKQLLEDDKVLRKAFMLMNKAMMKSKHPSWRPFQFGFLLANIRCIAEPEPESEIADIVWFATGGGKTETYLGLLITAALHDRMTGKITGITAWSRFPLRMLSLQQMQRFADAFAAAELVRREENIEGEPFSIGFFVGDDATPNSIRVTKAGAYNKWDADDPENMEKLTVLESCPFCHNKSVEIAFESELWRLEHSCTGYQKDCPWPEKILPFYIVDDEIYRFLPTIIIGTLDKAASIGMQASMRGMVGAPYGLCSRPGHGYTYAKRSTRPNGCLVPNCNAKVDELPMGAERFAPSFRLQDELHLLKDSLGAVDSHYEALYDGLQLEISGRKPKILASSATLTGYQKQCDVLYRREGRVFPCQGPSANETFWSKPQKKLMRRFVAVSPRGVTIEYTVDRLLTELQKAVRDLLADPKTITSRIGVEEKWANFLINLYGTDVVYGNTLRDLDAVVRSMSTQVQVEEGGNLVVESLTGRTEFSEVRKILQQLEKPEESFQDRIHLISASSMMSHGVDIDRLNVMVMLGMPLTTAEFIQATARVGRKWPGIVFLIHKMGRERDAGVFRLFDKFVDQGDRFIEPIPITKRSRRVLERTIAGLAMARILMIHEHSSPKALTMIRFFAPYVRDKHFSRDKEIAAIKSYLGLDDAADKKMMDDIELWYDVFFRKILDPTPGTTFVNEASRTGKAMTSLRDVEEQVRVMLEYRI